MATLRLSGIEKTYGADARVLKGIDLKIDDGEFLVLVGPSGCGKSTLLRLIAGLEEITAGDLYIDGLKVNKLAPKDRDLAMVFQSYALYPHMTVAENMGFSLGIRRRPREEIDAKVGEAAEMLGLGELLGRYPRELSGGQRQRVAIGRAIVRKPKVFLFDEPLSNLDANLRAQMRVELKKLHHKLGVTMIYVTHDQVEAMTLAERICVLEGGYARQVDTPHNLYERPNSVFVAEFIGSPPMNFLRLKRGEGSVLSAEGVSIPLPSGADGISLPDTVLAGIRPHELHLTGNEFTDPGFVEAEVEVVETVGWDVHLHCRAGTETLIAQVAAGEAKDVKTGAILRFRVDARFVKLFDPKTEMSIALEG